MLVFVSISLHLPRGHFGYNFVSHSQMTREPGSFQLIFLEPSHTRVAALLPLEEECLLCLPRVAFFIVPGTKTQAKVQESVAEGPLTMNHFGLMFTGARSKGNQRDTPQVRGSDLRQSRLKWWQICCLISKS